MHGERYPLDEDFLAALGADAAGLRHRARLRPAGDAGNRRAAHRAGAVDAGGGTAVDSPHDDPPSIRTGRGRPRAAGEARRSGARRAALRGRDHAAGRGADRPRRSARSDRAPVRARRRRADHDAGRARRSDRRRRAFAGRRHRAPLSGPRAAQARERLRGLLPLLLPPRDGRAGQADALARQARCRARLHRGASADLGSDPHRRRSAGAVGAPPRRGRSSASPRSSTSRSSACTRGCRSCRRRRSRPRWSAR